MIVYAVALCAALGVVAGGLVAWKRFTSREFDYVPQALALIAAGAAAFTLHVGGVNPITAFGLDQRPSLLAVMSVINAGLALTFLAEVAANYTNDDVKLYDEPAGVPVLDPILSGVSEELLCRAALIVPTTALLTPALGSWAAWVAVAVTSLGFGFAHRQYTIIGHVVCTVVGVILAVAFLATGSLWTAIVAHVLWNAVGDLSDGLAWMRRRLGFGRVVGEGAA